MDARGTDSPQRKRSLVDKLKNRKPSTGATAAAAAAAVAARAHAVTRGKASAGVRLAYSYFLDRFAPVRGLPSSSAREQSTLQICDVRSIAASGAVSSRPFPFALLVSERLQGSSCSTVVASSSYIFSDVFGRESTLSYYSVQHFLTAFLLFNDISGFFQTASQQCFREKLCSTMFES